MRSERDRLLAVQFLSLRHHDQQADQGGHHGDQQHAGNAVRADPKGACCKEFDVAKAEPVVAPQPAIARPK